MECLINLNDFSQGIRVSSTPINPFIYDPTTLNLTYSSKYSIQKVIDLNNNNTSMKNIFHDSTLDSNGNLCFLLSDDENERFLNFIKLSNNAPIQKHSISNIVRMFYLSAVTITTLGFGDIVLLTTLSRLLIVLESIIGVILIGLIINSIFETDENANKKNDSISSKDQSIYFLTLEHIKILTIIKNNISINYLDIKKNTKLSDDILCICLINLLEKKLLEIDKLFNFQTTIYGNYYLNLTTT